VKAQKDGLSEERHLPLYMEEVESNSQTLSCAYYIHDG